MTISGEMILGPVKVKPRGPSNKLHSAILTGVSSRTAQYLRFLFKKYFPFYLVSYLISIHLHRHLCTLSSTKLAKHTITQLYCNHHSCSCCLVVLLIKIDFIGGVCVLYLSMCLNVSLSCTPCHCFVIAMSTHNLS